MMQDREYEVTHARQRLKDSATIGALARENRELRERVAFLEERLLDMEGSKVTQELEGW